MQGQGISFFHPLTPRGPHSSTHTAENAGTFSPSHPMPRPVGRWEALTVPPGPPPHSEILLPPTLAGWHHSEHAKVGVACMTRAETSETESVSALLCCRQKAGSTLALCVRAFSRMDAGGRSAGVSTFSVLRTAPAGRLLPEDAGCQSGPRQVDPWPQQGALHHFL